MTWYGAIAFIFGLLAAEALLVLAIIWWWKRSSAREAAAKASPQAVVDEMMGRLQISNAAAFMEGLSREQVAQALAENYRRVWKMWELEMKEADNQQRRRDAELLAHYAKEVYERSLKYYSLWELKP